MKKIVSIVLIAALSVHALASPPKVVATKISVKLRNYSFTAKDSKIQGPLPKVFAAMGTTYAYSQPETGWHVLNVPKGTDAVQLVNRFKARKDVENATPIYVVNAVDITPNDPGYSQQYGPAKVHLPTAWETSTGDPSVKIAVIDTGTDLVHPEFANRIIAGFDFVNNDSVPQDDEGHGTHCSGIAAGTGNNNIGIAGAAWSTKIMPVKVLNSGGAGTTDVFAQGILFAANNGADVLSISLGGTGMDPSNQDAVTYAWNKGCIIVCAAGNDGADEPFYPARFNHVLAVAATDQNDAKAGFSNFGNWVHVAAPGVNIYSTLWSGGSTYGIESGTSMACPLVAGSASLLKSASPSSTNADIVAALELTADPVGNFVVFGRINVANAISSLSSVAPTETDATSGVTVFGGGAASAPLNSLTTANDGNVYTINGQPSNIGSAAMADLTISLTKPPLKVKTATFNLAVNANMRAAVAIWFYNWNTNLWEPLKSILTNDPNQGMDTLTSFPLTNVDRYVNNTNPGAPVGTVKIRIRANMPNRRGSQALVFGLDQASITARLLK